MKNIINELWIGFQYLTGRDPTAMTDIFKEEHTDKVQDQKQRWGEVTSSEGEDYE